MASRSRARPVLVSSTRRRPLHERAGAAAREAGERGQPRLAGAAVVGEVEQHGELLVADLQAAADVAAVAGQRELEARYRAWEGIGVAHRVEVAA